MTIVAIISLLISGLIDGILEGWGFDRRKGFEIKYKVNPHGFFGSLSHTRAYTHPNFYNRVWGVFDFYHMADKARKGGYILSGILMWEYLSPVFDINLFLFFIGVYTLAAGTKIIGMEWIRNQIKPKDMDKSTKLLVLATVTSFAAGLVVTFVDFSKGWELLIFPGVPFAAIGGLLYIGQKSKKKDN